MFPDLDDDNTGGAVGIIIPDTITDTDREIFESILTEITTSFKTQDIYLRQRWKQRMKSTRTCPVTLHQGW